MLLLSLAACVGGRVSQQPPPLSEATTRATQRPYTVNGERYEPIKEFEGYVESGQASWYGKEFHGKKTSSGETYDMHAMTAAHKTLPLGVQLRVKNLENGREAVVRINDRGPFVKGRIIDLSFAAARKLGIAESGTARVRIEVINSSLPSERQSGPEVKSFRSGTFTIQVASLSSNESARKLSNDVRQLTGYSTIKPTTIKGNRYFRVFAGKYPSMEKAEEARAQFESRGYNDSFVVAFE
jgi:rare lipoprotein A